MRAEAAKRAVWISAGVFLAAAVLLPWCGAGTIDVRQVLHRSGPDYEILMQLRVSRTLLALVAGAGLSLAGALFQAMLRDSLADPYTLGISAGASLGAVITICAGWETVLGLPATWVGSLAGAFAVLLLVLGPALFGRGRKQLSAFTLLLTGIAINSVCAAGILILSSFAGIVRSFSIARWLIGSVDATSYSSLSVLGVVVAAGALLILSQARSWNLLAVGEQWAVSRGVRVGRLMGTGFVAGSVLVAGAIALTGPIGFVGLIVPHLVRSRISPDSRVLMPCSFFLGGTLLAICDVVGRVALPPAEIPAGAVLALLGGPYLVWVIRRRAPLEA
jgi:iron complex transport system permease protein